MMDLATAVDTVIEDVDAGIQARRKPNYQELMNAVLMVDPLDLLPRVSADLRDAYVTVFQADRGRITRALSVG